MLNKHKFIINNKLRIMDEEELYKQNEGTPIKQYLDNPFRSFLPAPKAAHKKWTRWVARMIFIIIFGLPISLIIFSQIDSYYRDPVKNYQLGNKKLKKYDFVGAINAYQTSLDKSNDPIYYNYIVNTYIDGACFNLKRIKRKTIKYKELMKSFCE